MMEADSSKSAMIQAKVHLRTIAAQAWLARNCE
jgi:hypothetical protein